MLGNLRRQDADDRGLAAAGGPVQQQVRDVPGVQDRLQTHPA
jgi:hypothetical protein